MLNNELEVYLTRLEKCLGPLGISEKAEIITEIKSHVMDTLDNNDTETVKEVLDALGTPRQVAQKYLTEKGIEPKKDSDNSVVKWVSLSLISVIGACLVLMIVLVWKFSPLVKVDGENGRVQILGGMIDIENNEDFNFDIRSGNSEGTILEGEHTLLNSK